MRLEIVINEFGDRLSRFFVDFPFFVVGVGHDPPYKREAGEEPPVLGEVSAEARIFGAAVAILAVPFFKDLVRTFAKGEQFGRFTPLLSRRLRCTEQIPADNSD